MFEEMSFRLQQALTSPVMNRIADWMMRNEERRDFRRLNGQTVDRHLVSLTDGRSYDAEQYRKLRHILEEKHNTEAGVAVAICSPAAGDGKSLTAVNIAATLAQAKSNRVLLVDADFRRESVSFTQLLGLNNLQRPGLSDAIVNSELEFPDIVHRTYTPNLEVIMVGGQTLTPYELLRSANFGELLLDMRMHYDFIIIDAPPVVPVSDCRVMATNVDYFLMVVAAHRTPRPMLEEALDLMAPEKMMGIIFNGCDLIPSRYYGYYGYYNHYYGTPTAQKGKDEHRGRAKQQSESASPRP